MHAVYGVRALTLRIHDQKSSRPLILIANLLSVFSIRAQIHASQGIGLIRFFVRLREFIFVKIKRKALYMAIVEL